MKSKSLSNLTCGALLAVVLVAAWALVREPLEVGLIGFVVGALLAAVVVERDAPETASEPRAGFAAPSAAARPARALIVGAGSVGRMLAAELEGTERFQVVGFVDDEAERGGHPWPVLGSREDTANLVTRYDVDEVILAYAPTWQQRLAEDLMTRHPSLKVRVVPSPYEAMMKTGAVQHMGDIALVQLMQHSGDIRDAVKRLFDVTVAVSGLIVMAPLMALVALLVKVSSPGPIILRQERVGLNGLPFTLYKFRTMVADAETRSGPVLSTGKNDARLTPVGRWLRLVRLDEAPQLLNVLRGDMSMVGPRPERPHFVQGFEETIPSYGIRHRVRPGLTGLAQVYGGYHTDARDKLRFDLIYVSHQSLWLDLCILARTLVVVVRPK